jgi:undecaprenyl-diphosphatase
MSVDRGRSGRLTGSRSRLHRALGPCPKLIVRLIETNAARVLRWFAITAIVTIAALGLLVRNSTQPDRIDAAVTRHLYAPLGSTLRSIAQVLTDLGSPVAAGVISLGTALFLYRRYRDVILAAFVPASLVLALGVEQILKRAVRRLRPPTAQLANLKDYSFPSGHVTATAATGFALTVLVLAIRPPRRSVWIALLCFYVIAVAASRIILGVHYLTDVAAAAALSGLAVSAVGWVCTRDDDEPNGPAVE